MKKNNLIEYIKYSRFFGLINDATYLKIVYYIKAKKKLNLKNPETFNEKIQWLKLHDRQNIYSKMVDKYEVKKYVAHTIGAQYIIPTFGVYDKFDDIDFNRLPNQFVIKCTHDSGGLVICKNKSELDIPRARKKIKRCLKRNFYYIGREWPYKNVKPRIIVEKYMSDDSGNQLKDYKIFCFHGVPKLIMVDSNRFSNHKRSVYDCDWKETGIEINYPKCEVGIKKPVCLGEMLDISRKLSKNIPFVRTDFYIIDNKPYFGEITFYPGSGFQTIKPDGWQRKLGKWINIDSIIAGGRK